MAIRVEADRSPVVGDRPTILLGIGAPRIAVAVERLLRAEERWNVETLGQEASDRDALAIVDVPFLVRSSGVVTCPAIVLVRSDVEREIARIRATDARAWLRTSATGDELLQTIPQALVTSPSVPVAEDASPAAAVEPTPAGAPMTAGAQLALLGFGTLSGALALIAIWQAIRP